MYIHRSEGFLFSLQTTGIYQVILFFLISALFLITSIFLDRLLPVRSVPVIVAVPVLSGIKYPWSSTWTTLGSLLVIFRREGHSSSVYSLFTNHPVSDYYYLSAYFD